LMECTDKGVRFTGTNLDDYLTRQLETEPAPVLFKTAVPLESLSRIVKGCSSDAILTITPGKDELRIAYPVGGTTITERVTTIDAKEFPQVPDRQFTPPVEVGAAFKEALLLAFDSCSNDSSRYILQHAYVDVSDPKAHYVVATNGREMFCANSLHLAFKESLIVPQRKFLTWNGFVDDGDWFVALSLPEKSDGSGWVKVQSDNWTLITRQIEGNYPNWKSPIPSGDSFTSLRFSEPAVDFLKLAAPKLPRHDTSDKPIALVVMNQEAVVIAAGKGEDAVSLPITGVEVEGNPIKVSMNRDYLTKALKLGLTELQMFDPNTPVIFRRGGQRLVVAPLREDTTDVPPPSAAHPVQQTPATETSPQPGEPEPQQEPEEMKTINRIEPQKETQPEGVPQSAFVQVKDQLESLKDRLRGVVSDLNDTLKLLSVAQKEKKATEREIESIRETLRGLQQVRI